MTGEVRVRHGQLVGVPEDRRGMPGGRWSMALVLAVADDHERTEAALGPRDPFRRVSEGLSRSDRAEQLRSRIASRRARSEAATALAWELTDAIGRADDPAAVRGLAVARYAVVTVSQWENLTGLLEEADERAGLDDPPVERVAPSVSMRRVADDDAVRWCYVAALAAGATATDLAAAVSGMTGGRL